MHSAPANAGTCSGLPNSRGSTAKRGKLQDWRSLERSKAVSPENKTRRYGCCLFYTRNPNNTLGFGSLWMGRRRWRIRRWRIRRCTRQKIMERVEMAVSNVGHIPVLLDSLCFHLMRHGFHKTLEFIRTLIKLGRPLVVPVQVDTLSTRQNQIFEDLARTVLCLNHGEATLFGDKIFAKKEIWCTASCGGDVNGLKSENDSSFHRSSSPKHRDRHKILWEMMITKTRCQECDNNHKI